MFIRNAKQSEAHALSELALKSKRYWGYDEQFMSVSKDDLTVTPEFIQQSKVYVLEGPTKNILGFYSFTIENDELELSFFFIDPNQIGKGSGKLMWEDAMKKAEETGYHCMKIISDPYARNFYEKMGATFIREVPSTFIKGRFLPLLIVNFHMLN
ncbi:GNAT family N-acetyltransferase [Evansella halocellulosilytica]|uniref:GNAT family N-acetyltransferase n=1 Tax=Evansella halocellulosilytica TaxID=2011013 RepID=UPI000BB8BA1B|nr:GNAT family N-acetyltransferase [Evansella halocellulosilytica]